MATVLAPDPAAYDVDTLAWAERQAELLRAGRFLQADISAIAEEIEELAGQQRRELRNRLTTIVQHWLKLEISPHREPKNGWRQTIRHARVEIGILLENSPSLRRETSATLAKAAVDAAMLAIGDLADFGELDRERVLRIKARSFTIDEVLTGKLP